MNPQLLTTIGVIVAFMGMLIFAFGKKFFLFRYIFGNRSMLSQMVWGTTLFLIGLIFLFLGGAFNM